MKIISKELFFAKLPSKEMLLFYLKKKTDFGPFIYRVPVVLESTQYNIDVGFTQELGKRVFFLQATGVPWNIVQRLNFPSPSHLKDSSYKTKKQFDQWWEKVEQYYLSLN